MVDKLVCDQCNTRGLPMYPQEDKQEQLFCLYCPYQMQAECLVGGKPACVTCKMNQKNKLKSPAGSIRSGQFEVGSTRMTQLSDRKSNRSDRSHQEMGSMRSVTSSQQMGFKSIAARRTPNSVHTEFIKANSFLQKYTQNRGDLAQLYNSRKDGYSSAVFHRKCDDSKGGLIVVVQLSLGYQIAGFSWKGIRRGCPESCDVQVGGAIIKNGEFSFMQFQDQFVLNESEGIRFSRSNDLYLNFDMIQNSVCNFDPNLQNKSQWTRWIQEIRAYKLQV